MLFLHKRQNERGEVCARWSQICKFFVNRKFANQRPGVGGRGIVASGQYPVVSEQGKRCAFWIISYAKD
jgi:hypothetical protein